MTRKFSRRVSSVMWTAMALRDVCKGKRQKVKGKRQKDHKFKGNLYPLTLIL